MTLPFNKKNQNGEHIGDATGDFCFGFLAKNPILNVFFNAHPIRLFQGHFSKKLGRKVNSQKRHYIKKRIFR
jgi:hypothetical protein